MKFLVVIASLAVVLTLQEVRGRTEVELLESILSPDNLVKTKPPALALNGTTDVEFGIHPIWLELTPNGVIRGKSWYRYQWVDERLAWTLDESNGMFQALRVNPINLWVPDVFPYSRFDSHKAMFAFHTDGAGSNALIYPSGRVLFVPEAGQEFICSDVDLDSIWGEHECLLKFGSWTYNGHLLNIIPYGGKTELELGDYEKSSPLLIKKSSVKREVKYYSCCGDEPYPALVISLTVQRKFIIQDNGMIIHNPQLKSQGVQCD
ncbi:hypothetical protein TCAL_12344 [Tigriopus californicus]|uniref:Neurotransmitter-gated ion-channel ligand-binding domain-containing protein n=1 Tax=Tigriopus californicus TaxID=6832 RepID=A0A553PKQ8_TIGCA|nr:acetylcholine receptor subunit alpha-like 1 [Tigriopus californicus]TRY78266.1 hypothetical protein TCAL_12344 [Tigriopus californicus]|eukprot:TCALIF_12344-PA protein Name:"Similar to nAChRalpha1 Acetylcholine receptor subunit alpha-like 1 (Drosophila melanogaster)" AED:0.03 eAED:0.03 QI:126/1/1/1/1/1/3/167/262